MSTTHRRARRQWRARPAPDPLPAAASDPQHETQDTAPRAPGAPQPDASAGATGAQAAGPRDDWFEALLDGSSVGTPIARARQAQVPPEVRRLIDGHLAALGTSSGTSHGVGEWSASRLAPAHHPAMAPIPRPPVPEPPPAAVEMLGAGLSGAANGGQAPVRRGDTAILPPLHEDTVLLGHVTSRRERRAVPPPAAAAAPGPAALRVQPIPRPHTPAPAPAAAEMLYALFGMPWANAGDLVGRELNTFGPGRIATVAHAGSDALAVDAAVRNGFGRSPLGWDEPNDRYTGGEPLFPPMHPAVLVHALAQHVQRTPGDAAPFAERGVTLRPPEGGGR